MGAQVNILDLEDYWVPGQGGNAAACLQIEAEITLFHRLVKTLTGFKRNRTVSKLQLDYDITSEFSLMGRFCVTRTRKSLKPKKHTAISKLPRAGMRWK